MASLAYKFGLPTKQQRKVVRSTGAATDSLAIDVKGLMEDDLQYLIQMITHTEVTDQVMMGNDPSGMFVDKRATKQLRDVKSNVVVTFGSIAQSIALRQIERTLVNTIRSMTRRRTGALADISNWQWYYSKLVWGKATPGRPVDPYSLGHLQLNERLYLAPTGKIDYAAFANMKVTRRGQDFTPTRGQNKGVTRTRNVGFMGAAAEKMRKKKAIKTSFRVWVEFSQQFNRASGGYKHGTPCFVVRPTATLLNRRRYAAPRK